jgi:trigger factor
MEVLKVEETAPTKRKLTLKIEPSDLALEAEEAYEELGKAAEIPGFRKGKVPRKLLEYRFDKVIQKEAFADAVQKALDAATKDNEIRPVGRPDFDEAEFEAAMEKAADEAVEITLTLEVVPKFDLPEYKGTKVEVEKFEITEGMVQSNLESIREAQAFYKAIDDRSAQKGDSLVVKVRGTRGEEEVPALTRDRMFIPSLCDGQDIPQFDENFVGKDIDQEFEFDVTLDKEHPLYEPEGENTLHIQGKIRQITERIVPELDDDFAKDNNFENLDAMKADIRKRFDALKDMAVERRKESAVVEYLLDKTDISIPSSLTQSHYMTMKYLREREHREEDRFLSADEKREMENNTMYQARQEAKRELILAKIAEIEKIEVSDEDYYSAMAVRARQQGEANVDKFLADIDKRGLEDMYKEDVLFEKVVRWLVENNEFDLVEPKEA